MLKFDEIEKLHVELSSVCNAACPVCPRNVSGGYEFPNLETNTFTYADFIQIFEKDLIKNLKQILFVGRYGDPITCIDLPKILEYISAINSRVQIRIHTNGGIRSPEWWRKLATFKNVSVIFSIDGLEDTNHIYRRNVKWDKLIANVESYVSNGGNAIWEFLVFGHNQHQTGAAKRLSDSIGISEFILKRPYGFNNMSTSHSSINVIDKQGKFNYKIFQADKKYANSPYNAPHNQVDGNDNLVDDHIYRMQQMTETVVDTVYDMIDIDCHAVKEKEIYVDSLYNLHPCCWLAYAGQNKILHDSSEIKYTKWLNEKIGHKNINVKLTSIRELLNTSYFNKIKETWNKTHVDGRFYTCTEMCGKNKNIRHNLIVEE